MDLISFFSDLIITSADFLWNGPILISLLIGAGLYFSVRSKLAPLLYFKHSFKLISKKDNSEKRIKFL